MGERHQRDIRSMVQCVRCLYMGQTLCLLLGDNLSAGVHKSSGVPVHAPHHHHPQQHQHRYIAIRWQCAQKVVCVFNQALRNKKKEPKDKTSKDRSSSRSSS